MKTNLTLFATLFCITLFSQRNPLKCLFINPNDSLVEISEKIDTNGWIHLKKMPLIDVWDLETTETTEFLGLESDITFKKYNESEIMTKDSVLLKNTKYKQYYKNIPVECGVLFEHWEECLLASLNGNVICDLDIDTSGTLSPNDAIQYALEYYDSDKYLWEDTLAESELKIWRDNEKATYYPSPELLINCSNLLVYRFYINSKEPAFTKEIEIDALDGDVVSEIDPITNCGFNEKNTAENIDRIEKKINNGEPEKINIEKKENILTDYTTFGLTLDDGTQAMTTEYTYGKHRLKTNHYSFKVETRDSQFGSDDFPWDDDTQLLRHTLEGINNTTWPTNIVRVTNDHWGINKAVQYFKDMHQTSLFAGDNLKVYSNGGSVGFTAFNFGNNSINIQISPPFGYMGRLDVLGHEVAHKYIITFADLKGGSSIAESFADIYGTMVERYVRGNSNFDWVMGDKLTNNTTGLRSLEDPPFHDACLDGGDRDPDTYLGPGWVTPTNPASCGASAESHINCGVHNKFFYLLAEGGEHNGTEVTGIGIDKALEIADYALVNYVNKLTNFVGLRYFEVEAAKVLYGNCSFEHRMTQLAWFACGIEVLENCYTDSGPQLICDDERNLPSSITMTHQGNFTPSNLVWAPLKVDIDFGPIHIHTDATNWTYNTSGPYNNILTITNIPNNTAPGIYLFSVSDSYGLSRTVYFQVIDCPGIITDDPPSTTFDYCSDEGTRKPKIKNNNEIKVYPNPSNSELSFINNNYTKYIIYNVENKVLNSGSFTNKGKINIEFLSPGTYFIKTISEDGSQEVFKFIKI